MAHISDSEHHKRKRHDDDNGGKPHAERIPQPPPPQSGMLNTISPGIAVPCSTLLETIADKHVYSILVFSPKAKNYYCCSHELILSLCRFHFVPNVLIPYLALAYFRMSLERSPILASTRLFPDLGIQIQHLLT